MELGHFSKEDPLTHFEILDKLGKGSYGEVFKGRHFANSELVAIKVISVEESDGGMEPIRKEINILKECNHKNIVRYYGSYFKDENLWIIMEYCGGGSVRDLCMITEKPLVEGNIAVICRETLQGLAYLHSIGKIHRDIKGGNILLNDRGEVKLADFGVSAQLDGTFKKRNTFIGTPYWMAPEVIQESYYDGKADIWSVGITAIEMAELVPPHSQVHPMRVLFKILREPPPKISKKADSSFSATFHDFIASCTVKDPNSRPSASQLLKHQFISSAGPTSILVEFIEECRSVSKTKASQPAPEKADKGNAKSSNENMNSVIIREGTVKEPILKKTSTYVESSGTVVFHKDVDNEMEEMKILGTKISYENLLTVKTVDASLIMKNTPTLNAEGTMKRNDVVLDHQIQNICRRNSLIQMPFISCSSLNPDAMLSNDELYNLNDIFKTLVPEDEQVPSLTLTKYMGNLARCYAFSNRISDLSEQPDELNDKLSKDLKICLKTVLKL